MASVRQGVRSKVFIRTLIDIPEVKVHINHNSKERWKFNLQNNIQSVHVHKIPIFVGRSNAKTRPEAVLQYNLDTALSKICAHLKIKHMEKKMTDFQSVELIHYKPPTDTLEDIRPILNIPKFTFNVKDYPISEEELKNAKWKLPNNVFDSVNNTTPLCKKPEDLKGVDTDLFRFAMLYGAARSPKSRPACHITFGDPALLNISGLKSKSVGDMESSVRPFKLSVYRARFRKILRKQFMKCFSHDEILMKYWDGLYWFSSQTYPRTKEQLEEFNKHVGLALEQVKRLNRSTLEKRARNVNESIPWTKFKRQLAQL
ncbi:hypothetical protein HII12_002132 [Brettanomyces bruxellensis]|uniref:Uncharacterized protein n=1 Tax=Dekkera bruxellensis TaxID=5007 RepID=A0A8H6BJ68_DEKBR|nr:hypothetical protein HII12_002132 [Brettanomyces bruxellensis]